MADTCCAYTYGDLTINPDPVDGVGRLVLHEQDGITGLDGAPIRSQVDPKGQIDGGIVHPKFFGPRIIVFKGFVDIPEIPERISIEWRTALMALQEDVIAELESMLNSESALAWTPEGQAAHSINASYGQPGGEIAFTNSMVDPEWTFTLIASDPTITGA